MVSAPANILKKLCAPTVLAVLLLGRLLDRRGRLAQLLRGHHPMDLYGRSQPKEKGFRYGGDLGRIVDVDYQVSASCTLYL